MRIKAFIPDTTFQVDPTCNWFFMIFSTFLCAVVIGFCSVHMIEPRFGKYEGAGEAKLEEVTPQQKKGLNAAGLTAIIYIIIIASDSSPVFFPARTVHLSDPRS